MSTSSNEPCASNNQSFAMDELEQLIERDLKYSRDSALNDDLSAFDMKVNTLALVVTKLFKEMLTLRSNNDGLLNRVLDFQHFQCSENSKFVKFGEHVNKALENNKLLTEKLALQEKVLDSQYLMMCTMMDKITKLEKTSDINDRALLDLQQYVRRPTIEINGISENIKQKDLESFVINQILKRTNSYNISHRDIEAVHRVKKRDRSQPAPVVVRFSNRKDAIDAVLGRNNLKSVPHLVKIHIQNDLCPRFREMFDDLKLLQKDGIIKQAWTFNGKIKYKSTNGRYGRGTRVSHENDLKSLKSTAKLIKLERQAIIDLNHDLLTPSAPADSHHHAQNDRTVPNQNVSSVRPLITESTARVPESEDLDDDDAIDMNALLAVQSSVTTRTDLNKLPMVVAHPEAADRFLADVPEAIVTSKTAEQSEAAVRDPRSEPESTKVAESSDVAVRTKTLVHLSDVPHKVAKPEPLKVAEPSEVTGCTEAVVQLKSDHSNAADCSPACVPGSVQPIVAEPESLEAAEPSDVASCTEAVVLLLSGHSNADDCSPACVPGSLSPIVAEPESLQVAEPSEVASCTEGIYPKVTVSNNLSSNTDVTGMENSFHVPETAFIDEEPVPTMNDGTVVDNCPTTTETTLIEATDRVPDSQVLVAESLPQSDGSSTSNDVLTEKSLPVTAQEMNDEAPGSQSTLPTILVGTNQASDSLLDDDHTNGADLTPRVDLESTNIAGYSEIELIAAGFFNDVDSVLDLTTKLEEWNLCDDSVS